MITPVSKMFNLKTLSLQQICEWAEVQSAIRKTSPVKIIRKIEKRSHIYYTYFIKFKVDVKSDPYSLKDRFLQGITWF